MKQILSFALILLCALPLRGEPQFPTAIDEFNQLPAALQTGICEELLQKITLILDRVDYSLEYIAQVAHNNEITGINKKAALTKIIELRGLITQLKKRSVIVTKEEINQLAHITQGLINTVKVMAESHLKMIPTFDPKAYAPRSTFNLETIIAKIESQSEEISELEKASNSIGLTSLNKAFRRFEEFAKDHKLLSRAKLATFGFLGTAYAVYLLNPSLFALTGTKSATDPAATEWNLSHDFAQCAAELCSAGNYTNLEGVKHQLSLPFKMIATAFAQLKLFVGDQPYPHQYPGQAISELPGLFTHIEQKIGHKVHLLPPLCAWNFVHKDATAWAREQWEWLKGKKIEAANNLRGGQPKTMLNRFQKKPLITKDSVIGNEHAWSILDPVIEYLVNPDPYDRAGAVPCTGILLMGDPRTGKSFLAEALGGTIQKRCLEAGIPEDKAIKFYSFKASDLHEIGIRDVFNAAQAEAPVIVFFDELDALRLQREGDSNALCQFMTAMSDLNLDKSRKVVIMAATNKPQNLDFALLQPGRFGTKIQFHYPNEEDRLTFITRELTNRSIMLDKEYLKELAHKTQNCPFDELNDIITRALQRVKIRGTTLTAADLDRAYDEIVHKIIFESDIAIPEAEDQLVAIHCAGQALARVLLHTQEALIKVTSRPVYRNINEESVIQKYMKNPTATAEKDAVQTDSVFRDQKEQFVHFGKVITASPRDSVKYITIEEVKKELLILSAGFAAEKIVHGSTSYIYNNEAREQALNIAKFICNQGISSFSMSKAMKEEKLKEAYALLTQSEEEITTLLKERSDILIELANMLDTQKVVTKEAIVRLLSLPLQEA